MAPMIIAAIIAAAGSIIGQGVTNAVNVSNQRDVMNYQREEREAQNEWNEQMWNKQNEYNDPAAQLQRMRDAGLNPMFYGLDGSSAGSMPSITPSSVSPVQISNPLASLSGLATQLAQVENLQADTNKKNAETKTENALRSERLNNIELENAQIEAVTANYELEGKAKSMLNDYYSTALNIDIQQKNKNLKLTDTQISQVQATADYNRKLIDELDKKIGLLGEQTELTKAQTVSETERAKEISKTVEQIEANIDKLAAETGLTKEQIKYYYATIMDSGIYGTGLSTKNATIFAIRAFDDPNGSKGTNSPNSVNGYGSITEPESAGDKVVRNAGAGNILSLDQLTNL